MIGVGENGSWLCISRRSELKGRNGPGYGKTLIPRCMTKGSLADI